MTALAFPAAKALSYPNRVVLVKDSSKNAADLSSTEKRRGRRKVEGDTLTTPAAVERLRSVWGLTDAAAEALEQSFAQHSVEVLEVSDDAAVEAAVGM